jgi:diadenosine tetraphosphatase ApaH/serine/threonine PP2A family protein phosphatase
VRVAILTDIHANLPALEAVLTAIDEARFERRWCLGDVVGYGAQPDQCAKLVSERCELSLVGNHDLAVTGEISTEVFSASAAAAVEWTRQNSDESTIDFLKALKAENTDHEVGLYHASPRDPVWEYVLAPEVAFLSLEATEKPLVLVGHSHIALRFGAEQLALALCEEGTQIDLARERWLLNPGSVGQPRDGNAHAAWLLLDFDARKAVYHRVEYPVEKTQAEIRASGLPEALAVRLESGI